jgi:hypothetical protein
MYGEGGNCGRSYHEGREDLHEGSLLYGYNLEEQFARALEADVPVTLVTGWNEWIAGYWPGIPERPVMFVDCANCEYSRDIEMMRDGYFDNYYLQLCGWIRRLKGLEENKVYAIGETAEYPGFGDGNMDRCHPGYDRTYENRTGRYSIRKLLVENRADSLVFTLETAEKIDTGDTSGTFLTILTNPGIAGNGSYAYRINTRPDFAAGTTAVITPDGEKNVPMAFSDNSITFTVPKEIIGAGTLYLKACDSHEEIKTVEDFYDHGHVLPIGRADFKVIIK